MFYSPVLFSIFSTGAGAGIGADTARAFADEGSKLVLTGRRLDRLQALKEELVQRNVAVHFAAMDVCDRNSIEDVLKVCFVYSFCAILLR